MPDRSTSLPFEILAPAEWTAPAVFNSPHSGREFPEEFLRQSRLPLMTLRKSEDCFIDELFLSCVDHGAPLLRALVPRSYIDLNREPYELDPRMFSSELPGYANTGSPRVAGGLGTIPRIVSEGEDIYRGRLDFAEVRKRIDQIYLPYHRTLSALTNAVLSKAGEVLLVDCHSMPASATRPCGAARRGHGGRGAGRPLRGVLRGGHLGLRRGHGCSAKASGAAQQALCGRLHHPEPRRPPPRPARAADRDQPQPLHE